MATSGPPSGRGQRPLFQATPTFRIRRIAPDEAARCADVVASLGTLIAQNEPMYPNIDRWFREKVVGGIAAAERIAFLAYEGDRPVAAAVVKLGERAKICHLRIAEEFRDLDLGRMFFTQMIFEARHAAREIHFTLPESLWTERAGFFRSFGFFEASVSARQYRCGNPELLCTAPLQTALTCAVGQLPGLAAKFAPGGFSISSDLLMSVRPGFAEMIVSGSKTIEVRKRFSERWVGGRVVLYASRPVQAIIGEATVSRVEAGPPDSIWAVYGCEVGCSRREFEDYAQSAATLKAVELSDVVRYEFPIPLAQLSGLLGGDLRPPQSHCDLRLGGGTNWAKATSLASLLHANLQRPAGRADR